MKLIPLLIAASLMISASSCGVFKKNTKEVEETAASASSEERLNKECPEDLMCTMDFRAIAVAVETSEKQVKIDEARIYFTEAIQNKMKECKVSSNNGQVTVMLATDSDMHHFSKNGTKVRLQLRSEGSVITEKEYVIGHDCCHIKLIKGEETIKI